MIVEDLAASVALEDPADSGGRLITDRSKTEHSSDPILSHNGTFATSVNADRDVFIDFSHRHN